MDLIKMTYKGFTFSVNPMSIKTQMQRKTAQKSILFSTSKTQDMGFEPVKITGNGYFVGESAKTMAYEFMRIFKSGGSAYLFMPSLPPIRVVFSKLNTSFSSKQNAIAYEFEFIEDSVGKSSKFDFDYTYALDNENLYDVANRTGVSVEKLFERNEFKDLFDVKGGDKIWLV